MEVAARCRHGEKSRAATQGSGKDKKGLRSRRKWTGGKDLCAIKMDTDTAAGTKAQV